MTSDVLFAVRQLGVSKHKKPARTGKAGTEKLSTARTEYHASPMPATVPRHRTREVHNMAMSVGTGRGALNWCCTPALPHLRFQFLIMWPEMPREHSYKCQDTGRQQF